MVIPRQPKIAQNHKKSCSRGLPESTLKKDAKNNRKSHFSGRLDMQSAHACAVQTHFFVFTFQWPKAPKKNPKRLPKWSLWTPKITKKLEKRTLEKTPQTKCKKYQKMNRKETRISEGKVSQNHKNPSLGSKYAPSLQKGFPGTQKTQKSSKKEPPGLQNHSKSRESGNPKSRKS